jgi:predicted exporter
MRRRPTPQDPKALTTEAALVDVLRGRDFARWTVVLLSVALVFAILALSIIIVNQHADDVYSHQRADKQDQWRCYVAHQQHWPNPERWCP